MNVLARLSDPQWALAFLVTIIICFCALAYVLWSVGRYDAPPRMRPPASEQFTDDHRGTQQAIEQLRNQMSVHQQKVEAELRDNRHSVNWLKAVMNRLGR